MRRQDNERLGPICRIGYHPAVAASGQARDGIDEKCKADLHDERLTPARRIPVRYVAPGHTDIGQVSADGTSSRGPPRPDQTV